jgi:uncharacterized protein with NRDE domain
LCTVTYLPLSQSSFILTHNRDEHHLRCIAKLPKKFMKHGIEIICPIDEQGGGTWFATSKLFTLCLLNGAYDKHVPKPPYKQSRGLIILDFFKLNSVELFKRDYDFSGIEPFTLIIIDHQNQQVNQIVSDAEHVFHVVKNSNEKHIWSSSTLYTNEEKERRINWFTDWQKKHIEYAQNDIVEFHEFRSNDNTQEGFIINRNGTLLTVSLTSVQKNSNNSIQFIYKDFVQHQTVQLEY